MVALLAVLLVGIGKRSGAAALLQGELVATKPPAWFASFLPYDGSEANQSE